MNVTSPIVIWTTGNVSTGFGHVRRCLSLAEALRAHDRATAFLLAAGEHVARYVQQHGFDTVVNSSPDSSPARILREAGATAVVVDSYTVTTADLRCLQMEFTVAAIDDLADRELPVDIVINASPAKTQADYRALSSTQYLLGPAYALLRHEFDRPLPQDRVRERVRRVLITVGGSDPNRITPSLVKWCSTALHEVEFDVVAGPLFDGGLEDEICSITPAATCHRNPGDMRELMLRCDVAVCGGGQTIYELAATGTPSVAVCTASNQIVNLNAFEELGTLDWVGEAGDVRLGDCVATAVERLASNVGRRWQMSERGRSVVDGRGANRVAAALVEKFDDANQNR